MKTQKKQESYVYMRLEIVWVYYGYDVKSRTGQRIGFLPYTMIRYDKAHSLSISILTYFQFINHNRFVHVDIKLGGFQCYLKK